MKDIEQYFEILGLKTGASLDEVKGAYRDLVKVWHPDRFIQEPKPQQTAVIRYASKVVTGYGTIQ